MGLPNLLEEGPDAICHVGPNAYPKIRGVSEKNKIIKQLYSKNKLCSNFIPEISILASKPRLGVYSHLLTAN